MKYKHVELAENLITSKRSEMDESLAKIPGVHFFFSAITGTTTNNKKSSKKTSSQSKEQSSSQPAKTSVENFALDTESGSTYVQFYPGISYFIVYSQSCVCNPDKFVQCLQQHDMDMDVAPVQVRLKAINEAAKIDAEGITDIERLTKELCNVVKDHNNVSISNFVIDSVNYCYTRKLAESVDDWTEEDKVKVFGERMKTKRIDDPHLTRPVRLVLVNKLDFGERLTSIAKILRRDNLQFAFHTIENKDTSLSCYLADKSSRELTTTIELINKAMRKFQQPHALCNGMVYVKPPQASFTFVEMTDPNTYLHKLMSNETLKHGILRNLTMLVKLMSNTACDLFPKISRNLDLIEVLGGKCFKISERRFIDTPLKEGDFQKLSPRMFVEYNPDVQPEPLYFKEGILNSFPEEELRARFLNKFYECLMAGKMPHKTRKLVLCGPKDSGKTSWVQVLLGVIPLRNVATITQEKQFSAAMMGEDTELVFLDEWSENTLQADLAKIVLQGGYMVTCVKHQSPKTLINKAPFYITTNELPNFGSEHDNVMRRVEVFKTQSLPSTLPNVNEWLRRNSMHCIVWAAQEIEQLLDFLNEEDRWYEKFEEHGTPDQDLANGGGKRFLERVKGLSAADLLKELEPQNTGHQSTSFLQSPSSMLSDEITRMAQTELQSCETERQKPEEIKEVSSDEILSDEDDEQINSIGMHKKIYRNIKYDFFMPSVRRLTLFSIRRTLERNKLFNAEDHAWSLVLSSPKCEFDDALFFRRFPKSIEKIARLREVVGYRHVRWDSSDTSDVLTRARKSFANNSDKEKQIENKKDSDASKDNLNIPAQENKEKQNISCVNNEKAENNKEGSDKDILSISANNMEESEQDINNREFEQTALKDILNSSAQSSKDRQDINSENNEEKDNSNKRVSEESNESLLGKIVKRFKFK